MEDKKVVGKVVNIRKKDVKSFFDGRAKKANNLHKLAQVIYQDNDYLLACRRDQEEKKKLFAKVVKNKNEKVLDIGCGIGRWADTLGVWSRGVMVYLTSHYRRMTHGSDSSSTRHDHARHPSRDTAIDGFGRGVEPSLRHQPQDGTQVAQPG